jgi:two-component system LytT family sensor kinase
MEKMNPVKSRAYINVLLHLLVWMLFAFILLFYQPLSWNINLPYQFWIKQSGVLVMLVAVFYVNSNIFVPQLLMKNNNLGFILVILAIIIAVGPLVNMLDDALRLPELMDKAFNASGTVRPPRKKDRLDIFQIMMTLMILGISTSVTLIQKWQADKQQREALEKERIGSELSFLKAQINPHFFFNTLNNIYALTHVDVENSRRALHKLSRMMRYLLYDTQAGITPLSKEVSFIVDYLELMKLRLNDTTKVSFEGPLLSQDINIAPMLFLPYIENAFKHGVSAVEPSLIHIELSLENNLLELKVSNTIFNENAEIVDSYGGIGLSNTKRRLDLLYPGKHTFSALKTEDSNEFVVHLTLIIDDPELYSR